jgi:hypothetical protein
MSADCAAIFTMKITTGWLVRTETDGQHRYWKVGAVDAAKAAAMAAKTAEADTAYPATRLGTFDTARYAPTEGVAIEVVWETRPVPFAVKASEPETRVGANESVVGELTFDTIVPEDGLSHVEGCYRLNGGNWLVFYLTNDHRSGPTIHAPIIHEKAVFSSGISGISGFFPPGWLLNKRTVGEILAEAVGVDGWIEVFGPDSLLLK